VGGTPLVDESGDSFYQNTLKAMTERLIPNLEGARDALRDQLAATRAQMKGKKGKELKKVETVAKKEEAALRMLNNLISGTRGKLRNVLALPVGSIKDSDATERKLAEASALLEAGERKFNSALPNVEISSAIVEMDAEGNEVAS
jgi:hypothetical protein